MSLVQGSDSYQRDTVSEFHVAWSHDAAQRKHL